MKIIITFILSCCLFFFNSAAVFAQNASLTLTRFATYRIGVGVAVEYAMIYGHLLNRPLNPIDDKNEANENFSSDTYHVCRKVQLSPGFELGAFIAQKYYLGVVLNKHYTKASNVMNTSIGNFIHFEHQLKLKSYTNLFLKMGYKITPNVMFYGLAGPSFANWSHNSKTYYYHPFKKNKKVLASSEMNKKTTGFGIGGGFEYLINEKYAINMEYTFSMHKAVHKRYESSYRNNYIKYGVNTGQSIPADVQKKIRLSYSTIGLRFSYFFSF